MNLQEHLVSGMDEIKDSDYLEYIKVPLNAGTLVLMEGATQLDWQVTISYSLLSLHSKFKSIK